MGRHRAPRPGPSVSRGPALAVLVLMAALIVGPVLGGTDPPHAEAATSGVVQAVTVADETPPAFRCVTLPTESLVVRPAPKTRQTAAPAAAKTGKGKTETKRGGERWVGARRSRCGR